MEGKVSCCPECGGVEFTVKTVRLDFPDSMKRPMDGDDEVFEECDDCMKVVRLDGDYYRRDDIQFSIAVHLPRKVRVKV